MIKETYTMEVEIDYEFDENELAPIDATDLIDYYATANVVLNDRRVNILGARLMRKE